MVLKEKEITVIKDLQTQEKSCIEKYSKYAQQAKDPELKKLFETLSSKEQEHYNSLQQVLDGTVPEVDCNDSDGANYNPTPTYDAMNNSEDKKSDCFLATDCIGTEKLVSTEYNSDVFVFGNSKIRKLLADIQIEEQNHAEMLWKYKTANGMA
ncbi:MAG: ferritin-like domain-containing protein [Lachnospiraceae bacterium]|nr:ferritin-like domain-containing protein [Lachnospiraceae bacterium]